MDEDKLQKVLYFVQREAIIRKGKPMFDAEFRARLYGPVILEIHEKYKTDDLHDIPSLESISQWKECIEYVFEEFVPKNTTSLISLIHAERSWQRARVGYGKYDKSDVPMKLSDIYDDAEYRRMRRESLPLRHAMQNFYQQHPEVFHIPVVHNI